MAYFAAENVGGRFSAEGRIPTVVSADTHTSLIPKGRAATASEISDRLEISSNTMTSPSAFKLKSKEGVKSVTSSSWALTSDVSARFGDAGAKQDWDTVPDMVWSESEDRDRDSLFGVLTRTQRADVPVHGTYPGRKGRHVRTLM